MPSSLPLARVLVTAVTLFASAAALRSQPAAATENPSSKETTAPRPRHPLPEPANPALPTVFLIGDSTVRNGSDDGQGKGAEGQWGWGHPIADYFDASKVNVVNRAVGGTSSRTYYLSHFWESTLPLVKKGDVVIMQFGTNDEGALNNEAPGPLRARGTIKGVGDETKEIDNVMTKKHEVVHTYGWYLRQFVNETRAKGATPIICSLVPRKSWDDAGLIRRAKTTYAKWAEEVAQQEHVPYINLNELAARAYDKAGHDGTMKLFPQVTPDEHTHTNQAGAEVLAQCVISGLKSLQPDPVENDFSAKASEVAPAAP